MPTDQRKGPTDPKGPGKAPTRTRVLWAVPDESGPTKLHPHHLEDLRRSGLTDETIARARLYTDARPTHIAAALGRRYDVGKQGPALMFPFQRPGDDAPHTARIKPTHPRSVAGGRLVKYDQNAADGLLVYWEPRSLASGAYADVEQTLYFTEGEKKALLLGQLGVGAVVGLTGVWNWLDKTVDEKTDGRQLHHELRKHLALQGRQCVIVYDADARNNDQVMLAARQLAGQLLALGARAVYFVCPPDAAAKQGIDDYFVAEGEEATAVLLVGAKELDDPIDAKDPLPRVRDFRALRNAPVHTNLRVPAAYDIRKDGSLWLKNPDPEKADKVVALGVLLVVGYRVDLDTREHRVELVFKRRGAWQPVAVDAKATVDRASMLAELAPHMAPVTGNTAAAIIDWIAAFRDVNEDYLQDTVSVRRHGWATIKGGPAFVLDKPLNADGPIEGVVVDDRGEGRKLIAALAPRGDYDAHIAALRTAWESSQTCAVMICASLAAPLLELLDAPNFAVHLPGDSSRGKTSMLMIAASVWGDPDPEGQWINSWNTTNVAAELRAAHTSGLPQCYDEVGATDLRTLERMVYMLINGGGRSRGQKDLTLRETPSWRTIVLSTGEHPLASEQANTGAQVRVLQLHVDGFGDLGAEDIDTLRRQVAANCGHAGRKWIESVLATDNDWTEHRKWFADTVRELRAQTGADPLAQRRALYFGLLAVVESMAHEALGLGDVGGGTMCKAAGEAVRGAAQDVRPLADRARDLVIDWVASEPGSFPDMGKDSYGEDTADDRARLINGYFRGGVLMVIPDRMRERLASAGLAETETYRAWAARGWITPEGRHFARKATVNGRRARLLLLQWDDESTDEEGVNDRHT